MYEYTKQELMYTSTQLDIMQSRARSLRTSLVFEEVSGLINGYRALLIERDTLAAELVALRAGLPRWKVVDHPFGDMRQWGYALCYPQDTVVGYVTVGQGLWLGHKEKHLADWAGGDFPTARKQIEEALGLPPCEVEGE